MTMRESICIRDATPDDATTLAAFNAAMAWETEQKRLEEETVLAGVRSLLQTPQLGFYLLAVQQDVTVGCLLVTSEWSDWRNGLFWWVQSVYVTPAQRRQGIFRALYHEVRRRAAEQAGICGLRLYVERDNEAAQQTYAALGMSQTPYLVYEEELPRLTRTVPHGEAN